MANPIGQFFARVLKLQAENPLPQGVTQVSLHVEATGSAGTENFSGYYSEEYLQQLRGKQAADLWDKMRRSDPKIKMILSAVKNPIKSAVWSITPADESDQAQLHAELIEQILFKDIDQSWTQQVSEFLTLLDFGFSAFEVVHKPVIGHKKFGNYNSLSKIAWRSPRTIERWNLDPATGEILSIAQYAYGTLQRLVDIPGPFLLIFTHEKEGANYEGISALRPCYGPWKRKNDYLKLMAIGMEKFAIPTPYMEVPAGKEASQELTNAKKVLEKYVSHQQNYITIPKDWKLGFAQSNFDASKIREVIDKENIEMAHAFLANFLELGSGSGGGSYALSYDLSDFFLTGIEHIAKNICETINRKLIIDLIKLNFGPQESYPELTFSGIRDKAGKELAEVLKLLADGKIIVPDGQLEDSVRKQFGLPDKSEDAPTVAQVTAPVPPPAPVPPVKAAEVIRLADRPKTAKALIGLKSDDLKTVMQTNLKSIGTQIVADLMAKKKRSTPSQYLTIVNKVEPKGSGAYTDALKQALTDTAAAALEMVRKEIPGGSKVKLSEKSIRLADLAKFSDLPLSIQKTITSQIGLLSTFQIQDLLKALFFQFNSSVESTDSDMTLEADLTDTVDKYLDGASVAAGAGNTVSKLVNESRTAFFFEPDVIDQIESFTFTNGDPVSPICQDLAGTVFSKDDPDMERYSPPLHHNAVLDSTIIQTDIGGVSIKNLKVGDLVLTHLGRLKPITEWMDRFEDKEYFELTLENGKSIEITAEHPVLTGRGWLRVDQLVLSDGILCPEGIFRIASIVRKQITTQRLMNLAVADDESYVANGIVVHNCKSYLVANLVGSGKEIDPEGLKPSKASLDQYITLAESISGSAGLAFQAIDVEKEVAFDIEQAKRMAQEYGALVENPVQNETSYRFEQNPIGAFEEGSLKSFEPLDGVTIYYGKLKPIQSLT